MDAVRRGVQAGIIIVVVASMINAINTININIHNNDNDIHTDIIIISSSSSISIIRFYV